MTSEITVIPYTVSPDKLEIRLGQGQSPTEILSITNNRNSSINLSLEITGPAKRFAGLIDDEITVSAGSTKKFQIVFNVPDSSLTGVYSGELLVKDSLNKEIHLTLIITSKLDKLTDVSLQLEKEIIKEGDNIEFQIQIYNLGKLERYDILVTSDIYNKKTNELIEHETETVAIQTSLNLARSVKIPREPGEYLLKVTVAHDNETAISTATFVVEKREGQETNLNLYLIVFFIILVTISIVYIFRSRRARYEREISRIVTQMEIERIKSFIKARKGKNPKKAH